MSATAGFLMATYSRWCKVCKQQQYSCNDGRSVGVCRCGWSVGVSMYWPHSHTVAMSLASSNQYLNIDKHRPAHCCLVARSVTLISTWQSSVLSHPGWHTPVHPRYTPAPLVPLPHQSVGPTVAVVNHQSLGVAVFYNYHRLILISHWDWVICLTTRPEWMNE